jgi:A/G-specific adenine glycosylase
MNTLFDLDIAQKDRQLQQELQQVYAEEGFSEKVIMLFREIIYHYYHARGRSFSWREEISPYRVVVSEIMLQQTQTDRVAKKFDLFVQQFPDFQALAGAPFEEVLRLWKGLGYNRRALALQKIAQKIVTEFDGNLPQCPEVLATFPAIGKATASSILAFSYNQPTIFIETNIRTIFIYFFFKHLREVYDKQIMPLIEATLDHQAPRAWYYALMDYGVMLKKNVGNLNQFSKHYTKQSKFEGSDRQIRGMILQLLLDVPGISTDDLLMHFAGLGKEENRVKILLNDLQQEKLIWLCENQLQLGSKA